MPDQHIKFEGGTIYEVNINQETYRDLDEPNEVDLNLRIKRTLSEIIDRYAKAWRVNRSEATRRLILQGIEFQKFKRMVKDQF